MSPDKLERQSYCLTLASVRTSEGYSQTTLQANVGCNLRVTLDRSLDSSDKW